jgi:hypothetical protein
VSTKPVFFEFRFGEAAARQSPFCPWVRPCTWLQVCNCNNVATASALFYYVFSFVKRKKLREDTECKSKTFVIAKTHLGWFKIQIKSPFTTEGIAPTVYLQIETRFGKCLCAARFCVGHLGLSTFFFHSYTCSHFVTNVCSVHTLLTER